MASKRNMSEGQNLDMMDTPKIISDILSEVSLIQDFSLKSSKLDFHINSLEEELTKIDAFKRELPYCMQLLQDASERLKNESLRLKEEEGVEELIAIENNGGGEVSNKKTWMSRVRLWTTPIHDTSLFKLEGGGVEALKKPIGMKEEKGSSVPVEIVSLPVAVETVDMSLNLKKKQRRCWSPDLHKLFVHALHQLGGPYVATPKQIRELMNVEGLTNDEVKSHLQKYRLHIRKLPGSSTGVTDDMVAPEVDNHE